MLSRVAYIVVPGDSLSAIAQRFLGNGNRWPEIYQKNKGVIGPNPNLIYPGQKLVLWV
jgi:nucleoid-associated protein YgaU